MVVSREERAGILELLCWLGHATHGMELGGEEKQGAQGYDFPHVLAPHQLLVPVDPEVILLQELTGIWYCLRGQVLRVGLDRR